MKVIEVGGAILLLAAGQVLHGGKFHLDVPSYHGEPLPTNPFNTMATATVQTFSWAENIFLSRIPL
jgi:hypothetical protein